MANEKKEQETHEQVNPETEKVAEQEGEELEEKIPSNFPDGSNKLYRVPMGYDSETGLTDEQKKF